MLALKPAQSHLSEGVTFHMSDSSRSLSLSLTWLYDSPGHGAALVRAVRTLYLGELHGGFEGREVHGFEDVWGEGNGRMCKRGV
jgi:hypothetical protein